MFNYYDDHYDRPATPAESHLEWHRNSGVPVGEPCPWDACDPYGGIDPEIYEADQENLIQFVAPEVFDGPEPF